MIVVVTELVFCKHNYEHMQEKKNKYSDASIYIFQRLLYINRNHADLHFIMGSLSDWYTNKYIFCY